MRMNNNHDCKRIAVEILIRDGGDGMPTLSDIFDKRKILLYLY